MSAPGVAVTADSAAVHLRGLRFGWTPGVPVLDIPELDIARGERVFLHGASGSGKSTLLALLGGVRRADAGELRILGADLGRMSAAGRDRFRADHIGFVFQLFNLLPYLSLIDNVLLPCRFSRARAQRACAAHGSLRAHGAALLTALGLPDVLHGRSVQSLSVGQQQRVAVARALAGAPELVICDEPTSALDHDTREGFLQLLDAEVAQRGSTLIFVSHDRSLAGLFHRSLSLAAINRIGGAA